MPDKFKCSNCSSGRTKPLSLAVRQLWIILAIAAASLRCAAQSELTTEQANDTMRAILRQLRQCKVRDSPSQIGKGQWIRMRTGPPEDVRSELKNAENGADFYAVIQFTIRDILGSHLTYPTEAEALADEMNHVAMVEKHIHVYRISSDAVLLQARTVQKQTFGKGKFGKPETETGASCWEQINPILPE
jgi:hypothetical protein